MKVRIVKNYSSDTFSAFLRLHESVHTSEEEPWTECSVSGFYGQWGLVNGDHLSTNTEQRNNMPI